MQVLGGPPRLVQKMPFADHAPSLIGVYLDSDWAGCRRSRKSTSGGVIIFGGAAVRGWSSNQGVIALSSGEAEYYAALKGASCALGFKAMLKDLGIEAKMILYTDSTAARGIIHRAGLGKLRHLETGLFTAAGSSQSEKTAGEEGVGHREPS